MWKDHQRELLSFASTHLCRWIMKKFSTIIQIEAIGLLLWRPKIWTTTDFYRSKEQRETPLKTGSTFWGSWWWRISLRKPLDQQFKHCMSAKLGRSWLQVIIFRQQFRLPETVESSTIKRSTTEMWRVLTWYGNWRIPKTAILSLNHQLVNRPNQPKATNLFQICHG